MKKYFISIILLLFSLLAVTSAHARLTLGVVVDSEGRSGLMKPAEVNNLAQQLHDKFQEEIVVKDMPDAATVINWLDQYAVLDMALLSQEDVSAFRGKILFVGAIDKEGQVNLVVRQGSSVELTEKLADFVKTKGSRPWRSKDSDKVAPEIVAGTAPVDKEPLSIDDVIKVASEVEAETTLTEVKEDLVLAVIPELKGALQSTDEAEQLAAYLESTLPVEIKVKEFNQVDQFAEWFMRFRMVDLAVVSKSLAEAKLGRDYIAIAALEAEGDDVGAPELLVGRRGQNTSLQDQLKKVLLDANQFKSGEKLLTSLGIQSVRKPVTEPVGVTADVPDGVEAQTERRGTPKISEVPIVSEAQVVDLPEPVEPIPPITPFLPVIPERPTVAIQNVPPEPAVPDLLPALPATIEAPSTPELLSPPQQTSLPEFPEVVEAPDLVTPPKGPDLPVAATLPQSPQHIDLPDSPGGKVKQPVETIISKKEFAAPILPVEPVKIVPPDAPRVVATPADVETREATNRHATESVAQSFEPVVDEKKEDSEEHKIIEEVLEFAEPVSPQQAGQIRPVMVSDEDLQDDDIISLLGEDTVAALVAQPEIPQDLRPPGIPIVRPGRIAEQKPAIDEGLLLTSLPEPIKQKVPEPLPKLLPDPQEDQGVLYIVPFVSVMVPKQVNDRIFDRFVDALLGESENLDLDIVILKDGLKGIEPRWLSLREYVTGEIYGYIEEIGSDVIDLRAKAKLTYHTPNQETPTFSYLYPVSKFLDRDSAIIEEERIQLADNIAETLITEFLGAIKE